MVAYVGRLRDSHAHRERDLCARPDDHRGVAIEARAPGERPAHDDAHGVGRVAGVDDAIRQVEAVAGAERTHLERPHHGE